jgi:hypothetical protein
VWLKSTWGWLKPAGLASGTSKLRPSYIHVHNPILPFEFSKNRTTGCSLHKRVFHPFSGPNWIYNNDFNICPSMPRYMWPTFCHQNQCITLSYYPIFLQMRRLRRARRADQSDPFLRPGDITFMVIFRRRKIQRKQPDLKRGLTILIG